MLQSSNRQLSKLSEVEFVSALSLKIRTGQIAVADAKLIEAQFHSHLKGNYFNSLSLGMAEFEQAREWIARFATPLRTLDALHLAIAHFNQCELITADQYLEKSARILGVRCRLIR